jgi:glucose-1-phosphate thymidylyltransferase
MLGIVLAGGTGSRLRPLTASVSKQLLPVYDKPMIYYPISTLMLAGIRDVVIVTTPRDQESFINLLGTGEALGMNFSFVVQNQPDGIGAVFPLCETHISNSNVALILGDNIFHGNGLGTQLIEYTSITNGAAVFGYPVSNPTEYGVVEIDRKGMPISLIEKPLNPPSNLAIPGLYFYDNKVVEIAKATKPSSRNEIEITSINSTYLKQGTLKVSVLPRGTAWFDTGTFENLYDASTYVRLLEARQGVKIACLEEIAWRNGWISDESLLRIATTKGQELNKSYLEGLVAQGVSK